MSLANIPSYLLTAVSFLAMISVLVAAHEYGHYLLARMFGMGVEEFAIGMGKKLRVWRRKTYVIPVPRDYMPGAETVSRGAAFEGGDRPVDSVLVDTPQGKALQETTEFTIRMLPIGGFVRIKGMVPQDDGSEVNIPGGFYHKPPWQRLLVLLAGPTASVLAGIVGLTLLFAIGGVNRAIDDPVLGDVVPDSVAEKAGLRAGDRILAAGGEPIASFYDVARIVSAHGGKPMSLVYGRGPMVGLVQLTPNLADGYSLRPDLSRSMEITRHGFIGIGPKTRLVHLGLAGATVEAVRVPIDAVEGLFQAARHPSTLKDQGGSVVTMVRVTHEATQAGLLQVVFVACLLSISVGIFNLLPIPPLDGGQMLMAFAELLRGGRRLSTQVQQALVSAGVVLVMMIFVVFLFIDIQRYSGGGPKPPSAAPIEAKSVTPASVGKK